MITCLRPDAFLQGNREMRKSRTRASRSLLVLWREILQSLELQDAIPEQRMCRAFGNCFQQERVPSAKSLLSAGIGGPISRQERTATALYTPNGVASLSMWIASMPSFFISLHAKQNG